MYLVDFVADVELTEEEQIALLEQYEKELKSKSQVGKKSKTNPQDGAAVEKSRKYN